MLQFEIIDNQIDDFDFGGQNQIVNQQEQNNQVNPTSVDQADNIEALNADPRTDVSTENQNPSLQQKEIEEGNKSKKADKLKDRLY